MAKPTANKKLGRKHVSPLTAEECSSGSASVSSESKQIRNTKTSDDSAKPVSNKSKKRSRREELENLEEKRLTSLIFGDDNVGDHCDDSYVQKPLTGDLKEDRGEKEEFTFEIDRGGQSQGSIDEDNVNEQKIEGLGRSWKDDDDESDSDDDDRKDNSAPVWEDPDDAKMKLIDGSSRLKKLRLSLDETQALSSHELEQRLRKRYESSSHTTARTDWATEYKETNKITDSENDGETDDYNVRGGGAADDAALNLFSTSKSLLASSRYQLPPNILDIVRCPDANVKDPNRAVVRCIDFHPGSDPDEPLMLTAGLDKTLRFFQIGEEKSEKIHGIHFPKMPIYSASFLGDTGKVVLSGRRNFFYIYDAVAGKVDLVPRIHGRDERSWENHTVSPDGSLIAFVGNDGYIVLVDSHSKQCVGNLKLNGSVRAITFSSDGSCIIASGSDGDIYRWDVKSRQCIERFSNGDGTITSSLASSSTALAVGAESGVVNLYSEHDYRSRQYRSSSLLAGIQTKTPLKSIMNLHTSSDMVQFNGDGQILAMSSQREQHGLKLFHVPTRTVFSNWPTAQTPLGYVWSMKFSPKSKFLAIGNDKGKCLLYKINHYHN